MAIDTSASNVATSALQAIPFDNLIGGPLQAANKAQAMAAQTTVDFIQEVGFNTDANGNKQTVQVVFQYVGQSGTISISAPLLTLVPIPCLAIKSIDIEFKASISASASASSSVETQTASSVSAGGSVRGGNRFVSGEAHFNASYSSKRDSKSSQESKYSVEYTIDVRVRAEQENLPAGLTTILGVLTSAVTQKQIAPGTVVTLDKTQPVPLADLVTMTALVTNDAGNPVANADVTFAVASGGTVSKVGATASAATVTVQSDAQGRAAALLKGAATGTVEVTIDVNVGSTPLGTQQKIHVDFV